MTEVLVHEVMHNIDWYAHQPENSRSAWFPARKTAVVENAGCEHMHYLRSMIDDCFFVNAPQELVASIGNQYFVDTQHTLGLGVQRWNMGYAQPINQWLLVAELIAQVQNNNRTRFWRIDQTATVATADKRVRWTGDRIGRLTIEEGSQGSGWRFAYGMDGMVSNIDPLSAPMVIQLQATPSVLNIHETAVLDCSGTDDDDHPDTLTYHWTTTAGQLTGNGPNIRFIPPRVGETTLVTIGVAIEDLDGSRSDVSYIQVEIHPSPADFDRDGDVDSTDLAALEICAAGPAILLIAGCEAKDLDGDDDVDLSDFGIFQRCYTGEENPADLNWADGGGKGGCGGG